jgi:hypothetical protein
MESVRRSQLIVANCRFLLPEVLFAIFPSSLLDILYFLLVFYLLNNFIHHVAIGCLKIIIMSRYFLWYNFSFIHTKLLISV